MIKSSRPSFMKQLSNAVTDCQWLSVWLRFTFEWYILEYHETKHRRYSGIICEAHTSSSSSLLWQNESVRASFFSCSTHPNRCIEKWTHWLPFVVSLNVHWIWFVSFFFFVDAFTFRSGPFATLNRCACPLNLYSLLDCIAFGVFGWLLLLLLLFCSRWSSHQIHVSVCSMAMMMHGILCLI